MTDDCDHNKNTKPDEPDGSAPPGKRRRIAYDSNDARATATAASPEDDDLPFMGFSLKPIMLHAYKGFQDSRVLVYGNPLNDYKNIKEVKEVKEIKKAAPTSTKAYTKPKDEPEDWTCSNCKTKNKNDESKCTECNLYRSKKSDATGWGDTFAHLKTKWKCPACESGNDISATQCVACEAEKPDGSTDNKKGANGPNQPVT